MLLKPEAFSLLCLSSNVIINEQRFASCLIFSRTFINFTRKIGLRPSAAVLAVGATWIAQKRDSLRISCIKKRYVNRFCKGGNDLAVFVRFRTSGHYFTSNPDYDIPKSFFYGQFGLAEASHQVFSIRHIFCALSVRRKTNYPFFFLSLL